MEQLLHDQNLKLFRTQLAETTDEKQRRVIHDLFTEHNAKYRQWHLKPKPWCVAFRNPDDVPGVYVRHSVRFETEIEAKVFAAQKLAEGCDVSAGTINPYRPKRAIGLPQIEHWLDEALARGAAEPRK